MRSLLRHNRRWLGLTVVLMLLVAAAAPADLWRCGDGSLCPSGGPSAHIQTAARPSAAHSCCHPASHNPASGATVRAAGMQCFLTHTDPPSASLTRAFTPAADLDATPAALVYAPASLTPVRSSDWVVLQADLPPPPVLCASSGRSPPALS